jgi:hypothetical protein
VFTARYDLRLKIIELLVLVLKGIGKVAGCCVISLGIPYEFGVGGVHYRNETNPTSRGDSKAAHLLYPADGRRRFLRNVRTYEPNCMASQHRKPYSYYRPP